VTHPVTHMGGHGQMGNSAKRDAKKVDINERRKIALEARISGLSYQAIADKLGYSDKTLVRRDVVNGIKEIVREPAEEVLRIELARLDEMHAGCWEAAKSGDVQALDRALKIQDRRAKYLGLDAPTKTQDVTISALSPEEKRARWKELTGHDWVPAPLAKVDE